MQIYGEYSYSKPEQHEENQQKSQGHIRKAGSIVTGFFLHDSSAGEKNSPTKSPVK
jgi:hypothetical protein